MALFSSNSFTNSLGTISTIASIGGLVDNNQSFQNNDRYIYFTKTLLDSGQQISLQPTGTNTDIVKYISYITPLYTYNGNQDFKDDVKEDALWKSNKFIRARPNEEIYVASHFVTLTSPKGNLVANYAGESAISANIYTKNQTIVTYATFKSGDYSKYNVVRITIYVPDDKCRIITISY